MQIDLAQIPNNGEVLVPGGGIPLFTYFSETHEPMIRNFFLRSCLDEYDVTVHRLPQLCPSGEFMKAGWKDIMIKKTQYVLHAIDLCLGQPFVFADCDILFLQPSWQTLSRGLDRYDVIAQRDASEDSHAFCAGFFTMNANRQTRAWWQRALATIGRFRHDQEAANAHKGMVKYAYYSDCVFSARNLLGGLWRGDMEDLRRAQLPRNPVVFHANWTEGLERKYQLLKFVREQAGVRRSP